MSYMANAACANGKGKPMKSGCIILHLCLWERFTVVWLKKSDSQFESRTPQYPPRRSIHSECHILDLPNESVWNGNIQRSKYLQPEREFTLSRLHSRKCTMCLRRHNELSHKTALRITASCITQYASIENDMDRPHCKTSYYPSYTPTLHSQMVHIINIVGYERMGKVRRVWPHPIAFQRDARSRRATERTIKAGIPADNDEYRENSWSWIGRPSSKRGDRERRVITNATNKSQKAPDVKSEGWKAYRRLFVYAQYRCNRTAIRPGRGGCPRMIIGYVLFSQRNSESCMIFSSQGWFGVATYQSLLAEGQEDRDWPQRVLS